MDDATTRGEHRSEALGRLAGWADTDYGDPLHGIEALLPALTHAVLALSAPQDPVLPSPAAARDGAVMTDRQALDEIAAALVRDPGDDVRIGPGRLNLAALLRMTGRDCARPGWAERVAQERQARTWTTGNPGTGRQLRDALRALHEIQAVLDSDLTLTETIHRVGAAVPELIRTH